MAVVEFSTFADTPYRLVGKGYSSCYQHSLGYATPQNKAALNGFIKGIQASGSTYYGRAMKVAFDIFKYTKAQDPDDIPDRSKPSVK